MKIIPRVGVLLMLLAIVVVWTGTEKSRYRMHGAHYSMIFQQQGPVDVVALGSSRMSRAFDSFAVASSVKKATGEAWVIYDLSRANPGLGPSYFMLRDLVKHRRVRHAVIEIKPEGNTLHRRTYMLGGYEEIWRSVMSGDESLLWKGSTLATIIMDKVGYQAAMLLFRGKDGIREDIVQAVTFDKTSRGRRVNYKALLIDDQQTERSVAGWRPGGAFDSWASGDIKLGGRLSYYLERIKALSRKHELLVTFVHLPRPDEQVLDAISVKPLEQVLGSPLLYFTGSDQMALYENGYSDSYHCNRRCSSQLADMIAARLTNDGNP